VAGTNTVKITVTAADKASAALKRIGAQVNALKNQLKLMSTIGVAAMGAFSVAAVKGAADFEKRMSEVVALTTVTKGEIAGISDELLKMAPAVAKGPQELADAFYYAASGIGDTQKALAITESAAKAAASGLGETKTVVDALVSVMNAYGLGAGEANRVTDILISTIKAGKMPPEDLAKSIGKVIPVASQLGVGFDEVGAAIATMSRIGMDAETSAIALRGILMAFIKPGAAAAETLEDMGTTEEEFAASSDVAREALAGVGMTFDELRKKIKEQGLAATLIEIMNAFEGDNEALAKLIPNVRALTGFLAVAGSQQKTYAQLLRDIQSEVGITEEAFAEASDTFAFKANQVKASFNVLRIQVGNTLLPALKKLADWFVVHLPDIQRFVDDALRNIAPVARTAADGLKQLGDAVARFGGWILANKVALIAAITAIGAAFVWANPILGIAAGIAVITVALGDLGGAAEGTDVKVLKANRNALELKRNSLGALQGVSKGVYDVGAAVANVVPGMSLATRATKEFIFSARFDNTTAELQRLDKEIANVDNQIAFLGGDPAAVNAVYQIKSIGLRAGESIQPVFDLTQVVKNMTIEANSTNTSIAQVQIERLKNKVIEAIGVIRTFLGELLNINQTAISVADIRIPMTKIEIEMAAPMDQEVRRILALKKSLEEKAAPPPEPPPPPPGGGGDGGGAADAIDEETRSLIALASAVNVSGLSWREYSNRLDLVTQFMDDFNLSAGEMVAIFQLSGLSATEYIGRLDTVLQFMKDFNLTGEEAIAVYQRSGLSVDQYIQRLEGLDILKQVTEDANAAEDALNGVYNQFNNLYAKPTREGAEQQLALDELKLKRARLIEEAGEKVSKSEQRRIDKVDKEIDAIQRSVDVRQADEQVQKDINTLHDKTLLSDEALKTATDWITLAMNDASAKALAMRDELFWTTLSIGGWRKEMDAWIASLSSSPGIPSFQHGGVMPHTGLAHLEQGEPVGVAVKGSRGLVNYGTINMTVPAGSGNSLADLERWLR